MAEERKKSEIRVESEGIVVAQHSSMKKKKKKKNREGFAGEDGEIAARERGKLGVKDDGKKSKKKNKGIEADDDPGKSKRKRKVVDSDPESGVKKINDGKKRKKKSKKESVGDEIGSMEENQRDAQGETRKRKPDDSDFGSDTDTSNDMVKRKSKKKKQNVDSQVETDSMGNSKKEKKKKQTEDSEKKQVEANIDSMENSKKKQIEDSESAVDHNVCTEDANKKQTETENSMQDAKKKRKKKQTQTENSEARENNYDSTEDAKKKKRKKQVKFSDQVEVFPSGDEEAEKVELVKGKRFTKEEDELIKKAVQEYIDNHALGDDGLTMVLNCGSYPEAKGCWKEIESALPWRAPNTVYYRAHTIFEAGSMGQWSKEDFELLIEYQKKHGNDWKTLADAMGKHRKHVKDAWRRIRLNKNKGNWSREEYQNLFDLVNTDLRLKVHQEKRSKHGMLRDNIPWMAISDELGTRDHTNCCLKWYDQLTSPMVTKGIWANVDDYILLDELTKLDAACVDDVDWDNLLDNRDGEACRKRWNQMVRHIGLPGTKTFAQQVEILSQRYCPDIAEDRQNFDNRPFDDIEVKEDL